MRLCLNRIIANQNFISMIKTSCIAILSVLWVEHAIAQKNCLDAERLKTLDQAWEMALLKNDVEFLKSTLAENFIWVHSQASLTDSKESLLKRASNPGQGATGNTRSRTSSDVRVIVNGSTAVVTGFTLVDRGPTPTKYHFMRTYAEVDGHCLLVANQTMAMPKD